MDFAKVDAALASALNGGEHSAPGGSGRLRVSLRTLGPTGPRECNELREMGIQGAEPGRNIFSGDLTPRDLDALTHKPYVRLISLAQPLRPLS